MEVPVTDHQYCVFADIRQSPGSDRVLSLVLGASCAERGKGRGLAAALGREVAAESEHVRPRGEPQVIEFSELAEPQDSLMRRRAWSRIARSASR